MLAILGEMSLQARFGRRLAATAAGGIDPLAEPPSVQTVAVTALVDAADEAAPPPRDAAIPVAPHVQSTTPAWLLGDDETPAVTAPVKASEKEAGGDHGAVVVESPLQIDHTNVADAVATARDQLMELDRQLAGARDDADRKRGRSSELAHASITSLLSTKSSLEAAALNRRKQLVELRETSAAQAEAIIGARDVALQQFRMEAATSAQQSRSTLQSLAAEEAQFVAAIAEATARHSTDLARSNAEPCLPAMTTTLGEKLSSSASKLRLQMTNAVESIVRSELRDGLCSARNAARQRWVERRISETKRLREFGEQRDASQSRRHAERVNDHRQSVAKLLVELNGGAVSRENDRATQSRVRMVALDKLMAEESLRARESSHRSLEALNRQCSVRLKEEADRTEQQLRALVAAATADLVLQRKLQRNELEAARDRGQSLTTARKSAGLPRRGDSVGNPESIAVLCERAKSLLADATVRPVGNRQPAAPSATAQLDAFRREVDGQRHRVQLLSGVVAREWGRIQASVAALDADMSGVASHITAVAQTVLSEQQHLLALQHDQRQGGRPVAGGRPPERSGELEALAGLHKTALQLKDAICRAREVAHSARVHDDAADAEQVACHSSITKQMLQLLDRHADLAYAASRLEWQKTALVDEVNALQHMADLHVANRERVLDAASRSIPFPRQGGAKIAPTMASPPREEVDRDALWDESRVSRRDRSVHDVSASTIQGQSAARQVAADLVRRARQQLRHRVGSPTPTTDGSSEPQGGLRGPDAAGPQRGSSGSSGGRESAAWWLHDGHRDAVGSSLTTPSPDDDEGAGGAH